MGKARPVSIEGSKIGGGQTLLTPEEAAAYLRVCTKTLRRLRQEGLIPYVAVTERKIFFRPEDCDEFVKRRVTSAPIAPVTKRRGTKRVARQGNVVSFTARRQERESQRRR